MPDKQKIEASSPNRPDSAGGGVSISRNGLLAAGIIAIIAGACAVNADRKVETPQQPASELGLVRNSAENGDWMERAMAAAVLGKSGNCESIPILLGLLLDQDIHVRQTAADSLAMHKPRDRKDIEALGKIMDAWKARGYPLGPLERLGKVWMKKAEESRSPVGSLRWAKPRMHAALEIRPQNALPGKRMRC